ncbi:MAG: 2-phospho-L-lactate transferase [Nitrosopumilus sp.]|nr:2-phospho-L-lactate transferase [Nitrosopumilus sp.]
MITILAGGTGSIKLVRGLYREFKNITVISNVADNLWYNGLYICPDIDTIIYGLGNNLDRKKGWGIKEDSFNFLKYMKEIGEESWFGVGDKDLTTHILRTKMLKEGKKLSEITDFFVKKYNIPIKVIPASDNHYETHIITKDNKEIHLQEFWIKYHGSIPISNIIYHDIEKAQISESTKKILQNSKIIIFAPGNPITSIGSIINIKSLNKLIKNLKKKVLIISPFISNKAISGPSQIYMKAKNIEPTIQGLVKFYSEFANTMIFSTKDKKEMEEKMKKNYSDIDFFFTDILMNTSIKEKKFAKYIISNFYKS